MSGTSDGVALRTLVVAGLPLAVASLGPATRGHELLGHLTAADLRPITAFHGQTLPQGAKVGFQLDQQQLELLDERGDALLRAPRAGLDERWTAAARRLKGTMLVVLTEGPHPPADLSPRDLAALIEERAAAGAALGAVIGVVEERPSLPLVF